MTSLLVGAAMIVALTTTVPLRTRFVPSYFPKAAVSFFNRTLDLRGNGGKQCANLKFVNVGSG